MRVLVTIVPGLGHLQTMLPVAQALQNAGHELFFACAESFQPKVRAAGFKTLPAGLDWLEYEAEKTFPELATMPLEEQQDWYVRDVFADVAAHKMVRDILKIAAEWRPDLIVRGMFEIGGCLAGERLGLHHVAIGAGLCVRSEYFDELVGDQLAYLRSLYGLPPYPSTEMLYRYAYLAFVPPSFDLSELPLPQAYYSFQPAFRAAPAEKLPEWFEKLPRQPIVHVTLGTVFNKIPEIYRSVIEGLRDEPINLIVSVGRSLNPAQFGPQPSNVWIEQFLPHALLLPRCDLLVTHAGAGTLTQAFNYGLPLVLVPLTADQPFQAARCEKLGNGRVLVRPGARFTNRYGLTAVWPELSPRTIRETAREMLADSFYRGNAVKLQSEIAALPGPTEAVVLLENLVATHSLTIY